MDSKDKTMRRLRLLALLTLFAGTPAFSADVNLAWDANTEPDVAGYKVYYCTASGFYGAPIDVGNVTTYTVTGLASGTFNFAVTAYNAAGQESGYSNVISTTISAVPTLPAITRLTAIEVSSTSILIRWITDTPADSVVEYGETIHYDNSSSDSNLVTSHSVLLTNLVSGTLYHYRVKSSGAAGNLGVSGDYQFTLGAVKQSFTFPRLFTPGLRSANPGEPGSNASQDQAASSSEYVSVALWNSNATPATLTFTAYDAAGNLISGPGITNPAIRTLGPGAQLLIVDYQLFGFSSPGQFPSGWIKLESNVDRLAGFFLMFDDNLTELDGAKLFSAPTGYFLLPEIQDQGFTKINVTNADYDAGTLQFDLVKADGTLRASKVVPVAGGGSLIANVYSDIFANVSPVASDYIRVRSSSNLVPYELVGKPGQDMAIMSGLDATEGGSILYLPQYVAGGPWCSTLSIVNVDSVPGTVTLSFFNEDGSQIGSSQQFNIAALGKLYIDDPAFFGPAGQDVVQGYVQVTGGGVRLTGSLRLSNIQGTGFATTLPLVTNLSSSLIFSHVASNDLYFTGLSILNPNDADAAVKIDLYGSDGSLQGTKLASIPARRRQSGTLTQFFPELVGQNRTSGYVRVTADKGVAGFALFGTNSLSVLSAIPAQPAP